VSHSSISNNGGDQALGLAPSAAGGAAATVVAPHCPATMVRPPQEEEATKIKPDEGRWTRKASKPETVGATLAPCLCCNQWRRYTSEWLSQATTHDSTSVSVRPIACFDAQKLCRLAQFYPKEFSNNNLLRLELQLQNYIDDISQNDSFKVLENIVNLSVMLVETKRHKVYDMVYELLKLVLLLPVATASVERVFSALVLVKTKTKNKMGDTLLDDFLVIFIERDVFFEVDEDDIIDIFMSLRKRRIK